MIPYSVMATIIGLTISLFLATTYQGFSNYHQIETISRSYDTSSIAAASTVSRSASNLLASLASSLASQSATSNTEIAARYQALEKYLEEVDTLNSTVNPSRLVSTINKGLTLASSRSLHRAYSIDLIQSAYIPAKITETDKRYAQTLISEDLLAKTLTINDLATDFVAAPNRLRISSKLLGQLLSNPTKVLADPSAYALEISDRGLDLANLPNGVQIKWQLPLANLALASSEPKVAPLVGEHELRRQALAQIRLQATTTVVEPAPIIVDNPIVSVPVSTPVVIPPPAIVTATPTAIDLVLNAIPNERVGIIYNPNKSIDENNPIQIINKKFGGMTSLYKASNGDLQISIGMIPTKANGIKAFGNDLPKNLDADFELSATLYDLNADGDIANASVHLDVIPKMHTRYGTVSSSFKYNGQLIAVGSVIVAIRKPEFVSLGRPSAQEGDFARYRIYSSEGVFQGEFATQFGVQNYNKIHIPYTAVGTTIEDSRFGTVPVYQNFNTGDLFKNSSPNQSLSSWLRMQEDLALDTQINILTRLSAFGKNTFKAIYDSGTLEGSSINLSDLIYIKDVFDIEGSEAAFKAVYPDPVIEPDSRAMELFQAKFIAALNYAEAFAQKKLIQDGNKGSIVDWGLANTSSSLSTALAELNAAKKSLDKAISDYDAYILSLNTKTVANNQNSTNSTVVKISSTIGPSTLSGPAPVIINRGTTVSKKPSSNKNTNKKK